MNNMAVGDPELRKAVKEHYEWHGERNAYPCAMKTNRKSGYKLLHVRFIGDNGAKWASLMHIQRWADGHYTVEEMEADHRENERRMIDSFVNSQDFY